MIQIPRQGFFSMSLTIWDKVFQNFEISCMYKGRRWLRKEHFQKEMMILASDLVNDIKLYKSEANECSRNLENIFLTQLDCVNQTAAWNWNLFCQLDIINFKLEIMFLHFLFLCRFDLAMSIKSHPILYFWLSSRRPVSRWR